MTIILFKCFAGNISFIIKSQNILKRLAFENLNESWDPSAGSWLSKLQSNKTKIKLRVKIPRFLLEVKFVIRFNFQNTNTFLDFQHEGGKCL